MSRYRLHAAEQYQDEIRFRTEEAESEQQAASIGRLLARRGMVVWLREQSEEGAGTDREVGMFIGSHFLPCQPR